MNTVRCGPLAQSKGYERGEWATYTQWQERGAQVRKGEKSATRRVLEIRGRARRNAGRRQDTVSARSHLLFCRLYNVFNAAQVDGYTPKAGRGRTDAANASNPPKRSSAGLAHAWRIRETARSIAPPMTRSRYRRLPRSHTPLDYYSTRAHETGHWTARAERCNRQLGKRFGDNAYAMEELIAELGGRLHLAHLGLSTEPRADHAQYIESWLKVLQGR